MTTLLFYKKPVPLDRETHRELRIKPVAGGYSFAAGINSVPISSSEISLVASEYPIVFAPDGEGGILPVALLGVREKENLFVNTNGSWSAQYVPIFVRCYPFALHRAESDNKSLVLLDEEYPGFDYSEGVKLFKDDGSTSEHLEQTVSLLRHFQESEQNTLKLTALLQKHGLLVPQAMDINGPNGKKFGLDGFFLVDEDKLGTLDDEALLELVKSRALVIAYAHLFSLHNMQKLAALLEPRLTAAA